MQTIAVIKVCSVTKTNSVMIMVHSSGTVLLHMYVVSYVNSPSRPLAGTGMVDCTCVC